jgi:hypothetical protein
MSTLPLKLCLPSRAGRSTSLPGIHLLQSRALAIASAVGNGGALSSKGCLYPCLVDVTFSETESR